MSNSFPRPLSAQDEKKYVLALESGDPCARDILIQKNLRLVAHIAKKYAGQTSHEDLISIGTIGLIKAVDTYTSKRSTRLATYASRCIENEILMSIRSGKKNKCEVSISVPIGTDKDGNEISLNDIIGSSPDDIFDNFYLKEQVRELYKALHSHLTERERHIVILRYGLNGNPSRPQREIAEEMGISRSYVSRIEKKALSKLKSALINTEISD